MPGTSSKKGLGIRVVEGYQLPEQILYYPDKDCVFVLNRSHDDTMLAFSDKGGVRPVPVTPGEPVLGNDVVRRLGRIALGIQEIFGGVVQDIEWLTKGNNVVIVQSRPYPVAK